MAQKMVYYKLCILLIGLERSEILSGRVSRRKQKVMTGKSNNLLLFFCPSMNFKASLMAQLVKNPPAMQETLVRFLGREDALEKG